MRQSILFPICLLFILFSSGCGQQEPGNVVYTQADSILKLTLLLHSKISSPEIQRMHDFQEEINLDLSVLSDLETDDTSLYRYRELIAGLGQCMQACNQFHEEAFMLESSLREIMETSTRKDTNIDTLANRMIYEEENYNDLHIRIDCSLVLANQQAEIFYQLKPEIEKMKEQEQMP